LPKIPALLKKRVLVPADNRFLVSASLKDTISMI
jgi:hypothetical protein